MERDVIKSEENSGVGVHFQFAGVVVHVVVAIFAVVVDYVREMVVDIVIVIVCVLVVVVVSVAVVSHNEIVMRGTDLSLKERRNGVVVRAVVVVIAEIRGGGSCG